MKWQNQKPITLNLRRINIFQTPSRTTQINTQKSFPEKIKLRSNPTIIFLGIIYFLIFFINCNSPDKQNESTTWEDSTYEIDFSPCVCKKQDMIVQAKKTILIEGIKDYEKKTAKDIEPELESDIIENEYDHFLYDFSVKEKNNAEDSTNEEKIISAEGKIKQEELNTYIENTPKVNRRKTQNPSSNYGSKGLEVIKGFQSDRKKRQTINEISKSNPIRIYEIKRK